MKCKNCGYLEINHTSLGYFYYHRKLVICKQFIPLREDSICNKCWEVDCECKYLIPSDYIDGINEDKAEEFSKEVIEPKIKGCGKSYFNKEEGLYFNCGFYAGLCPSCSSNHTPFNGTTEPSGKDVAYSSETRSLGSDFILSEKIDKWIDDLEVPNFPSYTRDGKLQLQGLTIDCHDFKKLDRIHKEFIRRLKFKFRKLSQRTPGGLDEFFEEIDKLAGELK